MFCSLSRLVDEKFNAAIEKSLDSLEPELRKTFCTVFRCFPHAIFVPQQVKSKYKIL